MEFNLDKIKEAGYSTITPVVITNSNDFTDVLTPGLNGDNLDDTLLVAVK